MDELPNRQTRVLKTLSDGQAEFQTNSNRRTTNDVNLPNIMSDGRAEFESKLIVSSDRTDFQTDRQY